MKGGFLGSLAKHARQNLSQILAGLTEKPPLQIDEYVLEHMLLYHGLGGSSPANQPEFKDARADIISAIDNKSSVALCLALKVPPLWWGDKLAAVFADLSFEKRRQAAQLLLCVDATGKTPSNHQPLRHDDWQVRANAASLLAILGEKKASGPINESLIDCANTHKVAFCHMALALGKLQDEAGTQALTNYLRHVEPWFRVDAAAALANYPFALVCHDLAQMVFEEEELLDYMSVAITKKYLAQDFLSCDDERLKHGGCALIIGIIQASEQTFPKEIVIETRTHNCFDALLDLAKTSSSPLAVTAVLRLGNWMINQINFTETPGTKELEVHAYCSGALLKSELEKVKDSFLRNDPIGSLRHNLQKAGTQTETKDALCSAKYCIGLLGQLRVAEAEDLLRSLLRIDFPLLDEVIESLGLIGAGSSVPALLKLANEQVNLSKRTALPLSKQPVIEDQLSQATTYWHILKALGNFKSYEAANFLLEATEDFAPDKRAQALSSLIEVVEGNGNIKLQVDIEQVLRTKLNDRSPLVKLAALRGAAKLSIGSLIPQVVRLLDAQENNLSKEAFATLSQLAKQGYLAAMSAPLAQKLKRERQEHKKQQIQLLLRQ